MSSFTAACVQMRSGMDPATNVEAASGLIRRAAAAGADLIATPEMTSLMVRTREQLFEQVQDEANDPALATFQALAGELGIHLLIGSLAIRLSAERCANRSFLIGPDSDILARYDKLHMFDVDVDEDNRWQESATYQAGDTACLAETPLGQIGLTICYDVRFAALYTALAQAGADILTVPAAFTAVTGEAHWHTLLRARAIETGCYIIAPAQSGLHEDGRETYGHSLIINPWGEIIGQAETSDPGIVVAEIDLEQVKQARARIPSLKHGREIRLA